MKLDRVTYEYSKDKTNSLYKTISPFLSCPFVFKSKSKSNYVLEFLEDKNYVYKRQFRFQITHSTSHDIITQVKRVWKAIDTVTYGVGVFLKRTNAFDTVDLCYS